MTDIRAEYGAGPVIRKALTEKGYNTKGEKIQTEDLTDLTGKKLVQAVALVDEQVAIAAVGAVIVGIALDRPN